MKPSTKPTTIGCCATAASQPAGIASSPSQILAARWNRLDKPVLAAALIVFGITLWLPEQLFASLRFTGHSLLGIAPWLSVSVLFAAYAKASNADALIARAFTGSPVRTIVLASLFGALSPFCSCGVVPVIAGLLSAGVPLAPVMAFWMSSPLMDPEMFALTAASLGIEFALVKTVAAIGIGILSGTITHFLVARGMLSESLRHAVSAANPLSDHSTRPQWNALKSPKTRAVLITSVVSNGWFLVRWMTIAFLLESLMVAYLPAEKVVSLLGQGATAIPLAVLIGIPAYLNGFAALPLVSGLISMGMNPAVALAFLVGGGITSIPAATAVWALVKPRVFALYLVLAVVGSLGVAYTYSALLALR